MRPRTVSRLYPCIFTGSHIREVTDPQVKRLFEERGLKVPWGDLRTQWRAEHCATLNPYASEDCPYSHIECEQAFLETIREVLAQEPSNVMGLFRSFARAKGAQRADDAQGSRHRGRLQGGRGQGHARPLLASTHDVQGPAPDEGGAGLLEGSAGEAMHRPGRGPVRLGTMLGSLDLGPRPQPRRRDEGETGA